MRKFFIVVFLNACLVFAAEAQEIKAPRDIPVSAFAQLPAVSEPKLSPDGTTVAYIGVHEGMRNLVIMPISPASPSRGVAVPSEKGLTANWVRWVNNDRLIVSYRFTNLRFHGKPLMQTRLISLDANAGNPKFLIAYDKQSGSAIEPTGDFAPRQDNVISILGDDPENFLLSIDPEQNRDAEVRRVNVETARNKTIRPELQNNQHWIVDLDGNPRIAVGYEGDSRTPLILVSGDSSAHMDFSEHEIISNGYQPLAFSRDKDKVYLFNGSGRGAIDIVLYDLETREARTVFYNQAFSADHLVFDDHTDEPLGVQYISHQPMVSYFDEAWTERQKAVDVALPATNNRIVSSSRDHKKHIVLSNSDRVADIYYLFNESENTLMLIAESYPGLPPELMSMTRLVTYQARDGATIDGYLTLPYGKGGENLPVVVLPHGLHTRTTPLNSLSQIHGFQDRAFIEFNYLVQFLASHGYAVFQPNYRGSAGYSQEFQAMGNREWGLKIQDDITDGVNWLVAEGIAESGRVCILGRDFGGLIALMGAVMTPDLFKCAVSINGISDLYRLSASFKWFGNRIPFWELIGNYQEAADHLKNISPVNNTGKINVPILLVHAKDAVLANSEQSEQMAKALKKEGKEVIYLELDKGGLTLETQESREKTLKAIEGFLRDHLD